MAAPNVVIGTISGTVGAGTGADYGANQLDGKALYQFTIPDWQSGAKLVSVDGTPLNTAINSADDLYGTFTSGQTRVIVIDPDGTSTNNVTYTVTAPRF